MKMPVGGEILSQVTDKVIKLVKSPCETNFVTKLQVKLPSWQYRTSKKNFVTKLVTKLEKTIVEKKIVTKLKAAYQVGKKCQK